MIFFYKLLILILILVLILILRFRYFYLISVFIIIYLKYLKYLKCIVLRINDKFNLKSNNKDLFLFLIFKINYSPQK